jgi:hypothetical protein
MQKRRNIMNSKNLWIASLSGAVLTTLVSNLPFIGLVNCVLCAGFWGSAIFAVWLYRRLNGSLERGQAVRIGLLTGLLAGVLGFALSFAGLAGAQSALNAAQQFLPADASQGMSDLPAWGAIVFNLVGVAFNIGFGALGGWIAGMIFNPRPKVQKSETAP